MMEVSRTVNAFGHFVLRGDEAILMIGLVNIVLRGYFIFSRIYVPLLLAETVRCILVLR